MEYKITRIFKKTGTKENGDTWCKINIQTEQTGADWLSAFATNTSEKWKVGDVVKLNLSEREYQGKKYYDYSIVKEEKSDLEKRVEKLEKDRENFLAEMKHAIILDLTGKFMTDADFEAWQKSIKQQRIEMGIDKADEPKKEDAKELNPDDIPF